MQSLVWVFEIYAYENIYYMYRRWQADRRPDRDEDVNDKNNNNDFLT